MLHHAARPPTCLRRNSAVLTVCHMKGVWGLGVKLLHARGGREAGLGLCWSRDATHWGGHAPCPLAALPALVHQTTRGPLPLARAPPDGHIHGQVKFALPALALQPLHCFSDAHHIRIRLAGQACSREGRRAGTGAAQRRAPWPAGVASSSAGAETRAAAMSQGPVYSCGTAHRS